MADINIPPPDSSVWVPIVGESGFQHLYDMWRRSGGELDFVNKQSVQELYPWTFAFQNSGAQKKVYTVTTSTAYTTAGDMFVIVTGAVTITLDAYPRDQQKTTIHRNTTAGPVVVSGTINGDSSYTMLANRETIDLEYSVDAGGWLIT